jgi:hypothetical protein
MKTASCFLATLLLAALLLAVFGMTLHAQDDRSFEGHWWCSSLDQEGPAYITEVWTGNYFVGEVMNAFAQSCSPNMPTRRW